MKISNGNEREERKKKEEDRWEKGDSWHAEKKKQQLRLII